MKSYTILTFTIYIFILKHGGSFGCSIGLLHITQKKLVAVLKPLSSGETFEFIEENSETIKDQIQKVFEEETCSTVEAKYENETTRMVKLKI